MTTQRQQRNQAIYRTFLEMLGTDTVMNIYARLGIRYYLSENRIRAIIKQMQTRSQSANLG